MSIEESDILFKLIVEKYGDRLTSEELEEVKKGVERITEAAEALRKVKTSNWDEPFTFFKPYTKEE
jgi:Asp-tRNA(Asn)/Glu-tRNA(Gln) amidotransferase C subunit